MFSTAVMHDILSTDFLEAIIVGGGTCGLAAAARLCESTPGAIFTNDEHLRFHWLRQRAHTAKTEKNRRLLYAGARIAPHQLLVLDAAADRFLGQWDAQFGACQIPHLRSPMFFHPDPGNVDAMVAWAHHTGREAELKEIPNVVGRELLKHQKKRMRRPSRANSHDRPGIVDVNMREWKDYYRPGTKFFHDFCTDLVHHYKLGDRVRKDEVVDIKYGEVHLYDTGKRQNGFLVTTVSGAVYYSNVCIVASGHRGKNNYPKAFQLQLETGNLDFCCHTTHIFSGAVPYPPPAVENRLHQNKPTHLVIVGGGLTSAQLAHVACLRGIPTTLLLRGPEKIKHFDFHLEWVTKYRNVKKASFYQLETDEDRVQLMQDAREGGLVNPEYHMLLKKHCALGRLRMMKYTTIVDVKKDEKRLSLCLETSLPNSSRSAEWKNTASSTDSMEDKSMDELSDASETSSKLENYSENTTRSWINADYVCCATGIQADINGLEFLQSLLHDHPIKTVGGFPCLTENLQWNDEIPLYMVGKNAALRIGPTSANLDGARLGAERVGWKIQNDQRDDGLDATPNNNLLRIAENTLNRYTLLLEA